MHPFCLLPLSNFAKVWWFSNIGWRRMAPVKGGRNRSGGGLVCPVGSTRPRALLLQWPNLFFPLGRVEEKRRIDLFWLFDHPGNSMRKEGRKGQQMFPLPSPLFFLFHTHRLPTHPLAHMASKPDCCPGVIRAIVANCKKGERWKRRSLPRGSTSFSENANWPGFYSYF